jgi:hypothetical protein
MRAVLLTAAAFLTASVLLAGCVSTGRDTAVRPADSPDAYAARVAGLRERLQAAPDVKARMAALNDFRSWLRSHTAQYERAMVDGTALPEAKPLYDEMLTLRLTLNHIPEEPFSPDYCDIVRNSIYVAWIPEEENPNPAILPPPVQDGLGILDALCAP